MASLAISDCTWDIVDKYSKQKYFIFLKSNFCFFRPAQLSQTKKYYIHLYIHIIQWESSSSRKLFAEQYLSSAQLCLSASKRIQPEDTYTHARVPVRQRLCSISRNLELQYLYLCCSFSRLLWLLKNICASIQILGLFVYSLKNAAGILVGIALNPLICFG